MVDLEELKQHLEELKLSYNAFKEYVDKYTVAAKEDDFKTIKQVVPELEQAHLEFDKKFIVAQSETEELPTPPDSVQSLKQITNEYGRVRDKLLSVEASVLEILIERNEKNGIEVFFPKRLSELKTLSYKKYNIPLYR